MTHEIPHPVAKNGHDPEVKISVGPLEFERTNLVDYSEQDIVDEFLGINSGYAENPGGLPQQTPLIEVNQMSATDPITLFQFTNNLLVGDPSHAPIR
jgi:hypothetical protein